MVAISLYRGNLHRVPDVPRRWLTPTLKISLKDFKTLLTRRNRALSRLGLGLRSTVSTVTFNPNSNSKPQAQTEKPNGLSLIQPQSGETDKAGDCHEEGGNVDKIEDIKDQEKLDGDDCLVKPVKEAVVATEKAIDAVDGDGKWQSSEKVEKPAERSEPANPNEQTCDKVDVQDDKKKRKREIEEKLETLNAKKHNLVQALKQVPHPSRASLGITSSPSCFAPTGHQGNSGNLPAVSVSGTNYIASSPSPAASGGTSVFRDAWQPSPWN